MASIRQAQYLDAALKLLPVGLAWHRDYNSILAKFLDVRAEQLEQVNANAHQLINERMPGNALILLDDWSSFLDCQSVQKSSRLKRAVRH